ncbi:MAG: hypothetical protein WCD35_07215, partial [Mycobacteriales bacterium]
MRAVRRSHRVLHTLGLALPVVVGVPGCLAAGWFELTRARAGHAIAWAYVFEWPFFALAGAYIWWQQLPGHDRAARRRTPCPEPQPETSAPPPPEVPDA